MVRKSLFARSLAAVPLAATLALGSGTAPAAPVITRTGTTPFYSSAEIMRAKRAGTLPAEVYGSPPQSAKPAAAVAPVRLPATVGGGRLVPVAKGRTEGVRLVLVFNSGAINPQQACKAPSAIETGKAKRGLDVSAALCRGNDFFSHAHLRDETVGGVRDPGYPNAMEQLLLALMPTDERADEDLE